jgi:hypothetical protein
MHHATKRALIARYSQMREEGATDSQIREEMENDPKIESDEDADMIIAELPAGDTGSGSGSDDDGSEDNQEKASSKKKKGGYKVVKEFRDKSSFSIVNKVGSDVSHFDQARLDRLVKSGLVEKK